MGIDTIADNLKQQADPMKEVNSPTNRHKLFKSLIFTGAGLSFVLSILLVMLELEFIDESISDQAVKSGQSLHQFISQEDPEKKRSIDLSILKYIEWHKKLGVSHFILIELYSINKKVIAKAKLSDADHVLKKIDNHTKKFPVNHGKWYRKIWKNWHLYLQTITPLYNGNNQHIGYIEGVYRVANKNLEEILVRLLFEITGLNLAIFAAVMLLFPVITRQQKHITEQNATLLLSNLQILRVLGNAIAKRDNDTHEHNYRVTLYAVMLANAANVDPNRIRGIIKGAFLHDVGKIAITDNILLKPGKLTDEEFEVMKTHVIHGKDIVGDSEWLEDAKDIVYEHHEKYGGHGYPQGLEGDAISIGARIFAIVDVFDALTSKRPYKEPFTIEKSFSILEEGKGNHFDPKLLDIFLLHGKQWHTHISRCDNAQLDVLLAEVIQRYFGVSEPD